MEYYLISLIAKIGFYLFATKVFLHHKPCEKVIFSIKHKKGVHKFVNTKNILYLCPKIVKCMIVTFEKEYLRELYEKGQSSDKSHRFQPQIVKKYTRVIDLMMEQTNVQELTRYGGLHYEHLHGDKEGISSVKVNDQYRIEFREIIQGEKVFAEVVSITELSNHYK